MSIAVEDATTPEKTTVSSFLQRRLVDNDDDSNLTSCTDDGSEEGSWVMAIGGRSSEKVSRTDSKGRESMLPPVEDAESATWKGRD